MAGTSPVTLKMSFAGHRVRTMPIDLILPGMSVLSVIALSELAAQERAG